MSFLSFVQLLHVASSKEGDEIRGKISLMRAQACVCKSFPEPHTVPREVQGKEVKGARSTSNNIQELEKSSEKGYDYSCVWKDFVLGQ